ncbi:MAG: hypothetical protein ABII12_02600 [Planctomycetota bacterium]
MTLTHSEWTAIGRCMTALLVTVEAAYREVRDQFGPESVYALALRWMGIGLLKLASNMEDRCRVELPGPNWPLFPTDPQSLLDWHPEAGEEVPPMTR